MSLRDQADAFVDSLPDPVVDLVKDGLQRLANDGETVEEIQARERRNRAIMIGAGVLGTVFILSAWRGR